MGNPEGPADFSEGFPGFPPCQGFEDLVAGQLELPAEPYAPGRPLVECRGSGRPLRPLHSLRSFRGSILSVIYEQRNPLRLKPSLSARQC